jgi:hypothetical protein
MQRTLDIGWWRSARFGGVLRYHVKSTGRIVNWALLILLASQLIAYGGVYADLSSTLVVALVAAVVAAHRGTRFLLRFGTSRVSVWLGNVIGLLAGMTALLLGTVLLSVLMGGLTLAMANTLPRKYVFEQYLGGQASSKLSGNLLLTALRTLPRYILYTMEWTALFYLFACCLRRNRGLTILIVVGVPLMLMILTLIPAVRQAAQVVEGGDERQMMLLGVQWMKYLADAAQFIRREWQTIQLTAALVSLPLSYLCMRDTPQP